jgi:hypothetical protein
VHYHVELIDVLQLCNAFRAVAFMALGSLRFCGAPCTVQLKFKVNVGVLPEGGQETCAWRKHGSTANPGDTSPAMWVCLKIGYIPNEIAI